MAGAVKHIQGEVAQLPTMQRFPIETPILCNHSDLEAHIHYGIIKFHLHELFESDQLQKSTFTRDYYKTFADKLEKQQEKQAEQVTSGAINVDKDVEIINPAKRKLAKMKEARELKKVALLPPSGQPGPATLAVKAEGCSQASGDTNGESAK